jgi:hypothetical protein
MHKVMALSIRQRQLVAVDFVIDRLRLDEKHVARPTHPNYERFRNAATPSPLSDAFKPSLERLEVK